MIQARDKSAKLILICCSRKRLSRVSYIFITNLAGSSHLSTFEGIPQPRQESLLSLLSDSAAAVGHNSETDETYSIFHHC